MIIDLRIGCHVIDSLVILCDRSTVVGTMDFVFVSRGFHPRLFLFVPFGDIVRPSRHRSKRFNSDQ